MANQSFEHNDYQRVKADLHRKILDRLDLEKLGKATGDSARDEVLVVIRSAVNGEVVPLSFAERERLSREILDEIFGLGTGLRKMLSVVIASTDNEHRAVLQALVDGTGVARTVHTCASFPVYASDPVTRRVRTANPDVTLVDIPADNPQVALGPLNSCTGSCPRLLFSPSAT